MVVSIIDREVDSLKSNVSLEWAAYSPNLMEFDLIEKRSAAGHNWYTDIYAARPTAGNQTKKALRIIFTFQVRICVKFEHGVMRLNYAIEIVAKSYCAVRAALGDDHGNQLGFVYDTE